MTRFGTIAVVAVAVLGAGCKKTKDPAAGTGSGSSVATGSGSGSGSGSVEDDPWAIKPSFGSGSGSGAGSGSAQPPSTGNEMPAEQGVAMTKDQALQVVAEAIKLTTAGGDPPCDKIVTALTVALPIAYPEEQPPATAVDGLKALGKCAVATKRWRSVILAASAVLEIAPDKKTPAAIVRALAEMGEYDKALKVADELATKYPDGKPMLTAALTFVYCKAESWDKCEQSADAALAQLAKDGVGDQEDAVLINKVLRDLAWIVTGRPKDALADFAEFEKHKTLPPGFEEIKDEATKAVERGYYFEAVPIPQLPIGVYHLMGRQDTGALVTFKLHEHAGEKRTFRVEAEVPGVTERSSNTMELKAHDGIVRWVNPPLKMDFDPGKVRSPRPSQLALKVIEVRKDGDRTLLDETIPIEVLPRDYLPLKRKIGADTEVPTYGYLGAWITSNDTAIDGFLATAKARAPGKNFVGEQDATVPQVKAIFDELKAKGVSYVMDPDVTADTSFVQRTRLPADVLASTNAQCLEGTLLFASLFEAIGIKPIVVIVPGHAFVGWHTVAKDGTKGEPLFVETTMVGGFSFEQAVQVATKRVAKEVEAGTFKSGASTLIDVPEIRSKGFTAQPL